jgi:hypothetical protein
MNISLKTPIGEVVVKGTPCGLFFIHRPVDGLVFDEWHVSHRPSGFKFPCNFDSFAKARQFAQRVGALMDFGAIAVSLPPPGENVAKWTKGAPTKKQMNAVWALMKELRA